VSFTTSGSHRSGEHGDQETSVDGHTDTSEENNRGESHESRSLEEAEHFNEGVNFLLTGIGSIALSLSLFDISRWFNEGSLGVFGLGVSLTGLGVNLDHLGFLCGLLTRVRFGGGKSQHPDSGDAGKDSETGEEGGLLNFSDNGSTEDVTDDLAGHHENPKYTVIEPFVGVISTQSNVTTVSNPEETCTDTSDKGANNNHSTDSIVGSVALERRISFFP
jgi:hypothetical protein